MLRIVIITLFLIFFSFEHANAFDLDMTVDDEIRKNYNSSKLVNDTKTDTLETLPDLPEKLKNNTTTAPKAQIQGQPQVQTQVQKPKTTTVPLKYITNGTVKVPAGTVFEVTSMSNISDWQAVGTTVKFRTKNAVIKKNYSIPASTVFTGEIIETHQPQLSCNGGLVVVRINSMEYKGQSIPMSAYVTRANGKMIFMNNIKGERTYLKTMWKKGSWGRGMFNKMCSLTAKLGADGSTLILTPFPFLYGTICVGANTLASPVCAFFSKGGHASIPAGSVFKIKLAKDTYIE